VSVAADVGAELGEAPSWDAVSETLLWVDVIGGKVHGYRVDENWSIDLGMHPGSIVPTRSVEFIVAAELGFYRVSREGSIEQIGDVGPLEPAGARFGDGKCDPQGRYWSGTVVPPDSNVRGHLYRLDPDGSITTCLDGVEASNGLAWSRDSTEMYYIDTRKYSLDVFDFDVESGTIHNRRTLAEFSGPTMPDGMTVDADGGIWVTIFRGGMVCRYLRSGQLERAIDVPVPGTTSCAFGGTDLCDLFITTSTRTFLDGEGSPPPHAGAVFVARPGIAGIAPVPFAD
jgi:sugar lactone lactonase YvrE